jgi:hypothetical protein
MTERRSPRGWDEHRDNQLLAEWDTRTDEEGTAADEAATTAGGAKPTLPYPRPCSRRCGGCSQHRRRPDLRPACSESGSCSKGGHTPLGSDGRARAGVCPCLGLIQSRIRLQCRSPYVGECTYAACCLSGTGAPPGRREGDTRRMLAARSGQGHVRASIGLPTPCKREHCLHVSQTRLDRAGWRFRQRQVEQAAVVPVPNDCPPCPFGDMPSVDGPGSSPGKVV